MERKIGEIFEFEGKKLKVVQTEGSTCYNCYFANRDCDCDTRKVLGACLSETRTDNKPVIFVEVKDDQQYEQAEQPQAEQQPQKLDLCEILKYCPAGEPFWSPLYGDVKLYCIDQEAEKICVTTKTDSKWWINPDATITIAGVRSPEIMLYPSKDQRDWNKFTAPWLKKERFDLKTLNPFDKIIVRIDKYRFWCCELFSFIEEGTNLVKGCGAYYKYCVPYNEDTKYLIGTASEAPEFYRYWEN